MNNFGLIAIILLISSCVEDEMNKTIFVADATDVNLPAYSERGFNSFGAQYERRYFLSANDIVPCKITVQNGIMTFFLSGRMVTGYSSSGIREEMSLYFSFPVNETMNNYKDLMALHQQHFNLTDNSCKIKLVRDSRTEEIAILSGNLSFNRVQLLRINEQEDRVVISGVFDLTFLRNDMPEAISKGRFDVGISNLFVLPD